MRFRLILFIVFFISASSSLKSQGNAQFGTWSKVDSSIVFHIKVPSTPVYSSMKFQIQDNDNYETFGSPMVEILLKMDIGKENNYVRTIPDESPTIDKNNSGLFKVLFFTTGLKENTMSLLAYRAATEYDITLVRGKIIEVPQPKPISPRKAASNIQVMPKDVLFLPKEPTHADTVFVEASPDLKDLYETINRLNSDVKFHKIEIDSFKTLIKNMASDNGNKIVMQPLYDVTFWDSLRVLLSEYKHSNYNRDIQVSSSEPLQQATGVIQNEIKSIDTKNTPVAGVQVDTTTNQDTTTEKISATTKPSKKDSLGRNEEPQIEKKPKRKPAMQGSIFSTGILEGLMVEISVGSPYAVTTNMDTWYSFLDYQVTVISPISFKLGSMKTNVTLEVSTFSFENTFPEGGQFNGTAYILMLSSHWLGLRSDIGIGMYGNQPALVTGVSMMLLEGSTFYFSSGLRGIAVQELTPIGMAAWSDFGGTIGYKF
jgi:hypothetical protein